MAYQNELEQMMAGNEKPKKLGSYKAVGEVPVQQPQMPQPRPSHISTTQGTQNQKGPLRYYRDSDGLIRETYGSALPTGAKWVRRITERGRYGGTYTRWEDARHWDPEWGGNETEEQQRTRLAKEAQTNYAKEFRANLPQFEGQLLGQLGQETAETIKEGTKGIREGAASRGLLYSGIRSGAEGQLRRKASSAMATGAQSIRRGLLSQADKLESQAIQSGIDVQQNQQALNDAIYRQALGEYSSEMGVAGSLAAVASMAYMMSDINSKQDIQEATNELKEFLSSIQPYQYEYKDKKHGEGKHYSVMAQDLEKTEIGKSFVIDTPEGKMIDYGKAFGVMLAAISSIDKRLERLGV